MAKKTETVPFETSELATATKLCYSAAKADVTGMAFWKELATLLRPNKLSQERDSGRYNQLSKVFQTAYGETAKSNLVASLKADASAKKTPFEEPTVTDEMVASWHDYGRKHFSRSIIRAEVLLGYRDPPVTKAKGAATTTGKTEDAQEPGKTGTSDTLVKPSVVDAISKLATRCSSIQAELVQFQQHVRVPKNGLALIGDMAEQLAKMHTEIADIQALLL